MAVFALMLSSMLTAAPVAEFSTPLPWSYHGQQKLGLTVQHRDGPNGQPWTEVKYSPEAFGNFRPPKPFALEPGSILRVWVKGNGTEDVLYLYMFGGKGHRAYNLPLKDKAWKELAFDITEDFGENPWTWAEPRRLDLKAIREFRLFAPKHVSKQAPAVGLGPITFGAPKKGKKPAVLLLTCHSPRIAPEKEYRIIPHLRAAGFETKLKLMYGVGSGTYLAADQLARFNAVILLDLPSNDKGKYPKNFARVAQVLHEYVDAGGGLLCTAMPGGWNNVMPTINQFLDPWAARYLDEQVVDPESLVQSAAWAQRYPFCWADDVAPHPATQGVKGSWYPGKAWRADGILTTVGMVLSKDWNALLRAGRSARSVRPQGAKIVAEPPATIESAPPLVAARQVGKGRAAIIPMYASFLTGGCDHPSWNSMVWDGQAQGRRSDMKTLFLNLMHWLAEPSHAAGTFGGYAEPAEKPDYRPAHERPVPFDWSKAKFREPRHRDYLVLIGMRSSLSGGAAPAVEMLAAAKGAGYQVAVFTEPVSGMSADKWQQLCATCGKASDESFLAIPGLRYRDPQGNHYLLFGTFDWPNEEWHKKCFNDKGEVIDTYVLYAKVSGWRHVAIHSLSQNANHTLHLRHYSCVSVFTYERGQLVDDSYDDYLLLEEHCYYPVPLAVHFVDTPDRVRGATAGFQTRLWANSITHAKELLDGGKAGSSYFWNPKPTYLSSGVRLLDWQELNMNSWRATAPGTDKWRCRFTVESDAALARVDMMDGTRLLRRFRPDAKQFTHVQTGYHGKQQQITLRAADRQGREMVASHLKTHTMEHVFFMCGDRQNSLGEGSWGYQTWPAMYRTGPRIDIYDIFPPHWDGGSPGFTSFCTATIRPAKGFDAESENNLGMLASTKFTLMSSRDCTITREVGDKKFTDRTHWSDCKPTARLLDRKFITHDVRKYHFWVADDAPGFMLVQGEAKALRDFPVVGGKDQAGIGLYALSDHGGKQGELEYFAYTTEDGQRIVRHTPPGLRYFAHRGRAGLGDYFSTFPRKLGAPVLFPLTPVRYSLHGSPTIFGTSFGASVPDGQVKAGQSWRYRFLFAVFTSRPGELNETPELIRRAYGLGAQRLGAQRPPAVNGNTAEGGCAPAPMYECEVTRGEVVDTVYWLRVRAVDGAACLRLSRTAMPGALPIVVDGLNERWSAVIADQAGRFLRFIGVFEGAGYAAVDLRKTEHALFVGHPIQCGRPELSIQLLDWGKVRVSAEVHNPTDKPVKTWVGVSEGCTFMPDGRKEIELRPGESKAVEFGG